MRLRNWVCAGTFLAGISPMFAADLLAAGDGEVPRPEGETTVAHRGLVSCDFGYETKEIEPTIDVPKNFEMTGSSISPKLSGVFRLSRILSFTVGGSLRVSNLKGTLDKTSKSDKVDLNISAVLLGADAGVVFNLSDRAGLYLFSGYEGLLNGKGEISGDDSIDSDLESMTDARLAIRYLYEVTPGVHLGATTSYASGKIKWRKLDEKLEHNGFDYALVMGYSFR